MQHHTLGRCLAPAPAIPRAAYSHRALPVLVPPCGALQPRLPVSHRAGRAATRLVCRAGRRQPDPKTAGTELQTDHANEPAQDDAWFLEPFMRSFLLGLGAGCLLETVHVTSKFVGVVGQFAQHHELSELRHVFPSLADQIQPLFAADHAVAISFWVLFYVMEAGAIMGILAQHAGDNKAASKALESLKTLPQLLLPSKFGFAKLLFKRWRGVGQPAAVDALQPRSSLAAPPKASSPAMTSPTVSAFVDTDSAVAAPPKPASNVVPGPTWRSRAPTLPQTSGPASPMAPEAVPPAPGKDAERQRERRRVPGPEADPTTTETQWAHRQKELLSRRLYLKDFWYCAALSQNIGDKPVGVEMLSEKIVLFRNQHGNVVAINDVCPHRGAPLHKGWVAPIDGESCVVCPYHGWSFNENGCVTDVPASVNKGDWPKKPVISSYDVVEQGGFVWLFNGSRSMPMDARPPIPYVPELDDPKWKPVYGEIEFGCGHWAVFENAIDMAHIHYLHSDSFGNKNAPSIREMKAEKDAFSVSASFALTNKPVNALWEWSAVPEVHITAKAFLPSTSVISFTLGNGLSFSTFVNTVPISEGRSINRFALIRNLATPVLPGLANAIFNMSAWNKLAHDAMIRILSEDKTMVEQLRPDLLQREVNVKADGVQTAFRHLRQEYINLGYGVLPHGADPHA